MEANLFRHTQCPHQVYQLLTVGREQPLNGVTKPNEFPSLGSHPESRNGKEATKENDSKKTVQGQRNEGCWINLRFKITWCGGMTGWPSVYIGLGKPSFFLIMNHMPELRRWKFTIRNRWQPIFRFLNNVWGQTDLL